MLQHNSPNTHNFIQQTKPTRHTQDLRLVRVSGVTSQEAERVLTPPAAPLKPSDTQRTFVLHMSSQLSDY